MGDGLRLGGRGDKEGTEAALTFSGRAGGVARWNVGDDGARTLVEAALLAGHVVASVAEAVKDTTMARTLEATGGL